MQRFYSKSTGSTYLSSIHGNQMPADAVPITEARYMEVIGNPAAAKIRSHDADGLPILIDPPPHVPTAEDHLSAIAARRYEAETSGTAVDDIPVNTERDSQALLTGAALQAMLDPNYTVRWKTESGFVDLEAQQIIALATAVRAHVQACFDREAELVAAVDDGSYIEAMLEEGWP